MKIIIIGGRGTSTVIAEQILDANIRYNENVEFIGFALDDISNGTSIAGYEILCPIKSLNSKYGVYKDVKFLYCLYRPDLIRERTDLLYSLNIPRDKFCNFVHPSALVCKSVKLGIGNVILANSVINSSVKIGDFNILNTNVVVEHDSIIGNNNFIANSVCTGGGIVVGMCNFIGINTSIRNGVIIGDDNIIGMSSNVVKNVGNSKILYGNPAVYKETLNNVIR